MIMGRYTNCAQELLYKAEDEHGEELSEDEETEEEDGPIDEEAQLKASMGLPVEFITSSAQKRATQDGYSQKNNNGSSERRASNSEGDDGDQTPHRRIAKVKRSHELDVEENPQMSVEEAWDKLGLKRSHDPMFESVLKFKPQSPPGWEGWEEEEATWRFRDSSRKFRKIMTQLSQTQQLTRQTEGALLVHLQREKKKDWRKRSRKMGGGNTPLELDSTEQPSHQNLFTRIEDDEIKFRREVYSLDIPDYLVPGAPEHNNTGATGKKNKNKNTKKRGKCGVMPAEIAELAKYWARAG
ncbi:trimethylguanosine synthase-like isoform X2 [Salmo trutta]|uniref:trimethylguanosine synthase-like isoform X2 n=1 Tax=Salmo trutta TaxID=8032 RepID=UPI0011317AA8|nr:trimethylguanosine synthase-like isoform X2 [Salmo trutta]